MSNYQPFLETTKYTRVHNYLIDSVMPVVSPTAFKVLVLIWRHTQGFVDSDGERVKSAQMAYSVIKNKTGIKHNITLSEGIKELLHLGLIQVTEGKEYEANSYSIIMTHVAKSESDLRKCKSKYDADRKLKAKSENDVPPTSENDDIKRKNTIKEKNTTAVNDAPPPTKPPTTKALTPHQLIIQTYVEELGYNPPNGGMMGKAAKWLAQNGYTPDQVRNCYRYVKAQKFYQDKMLSLQIVQRELPEFVKRNQPPSPQQPQQLSMVERGGEMIRRIG